jgi:tRNA(His) guanylyltransferase
MNDPLGERIKDQYENRTRFSLPRRTFTIIRLDGKAFHTYTRGLEKPFDQGLFEDMDNAIIQLLPQIQGAQFAYTQSDEISILVTDFEKPTTDSWFDGNIQKMCSVSASIITAEFNKLRWKRVYEKERTNNMALSIEDRQIMKLNFVGLPTAYFDSRVFTIPDRIEVMNYFIWRNQDCARNSVSMVAQSLFSHKMLQGKSTAEMQEMMFQNYQLNWADYDPAKKNGRLIVKESYTTKEDGVQLDNIFSNLCDGTKKPVNYIPPTRTKWVSKPAWKFTEDKEKLLLMIPQYL